MLPYDPKRSTPPKPPEKREPPDDRDPRKYIRDDVGSGNGGIGPPFKWTFFPILALSLLSLLGAGVEGFYFAWYAAAAYGALVVVIGILIGIVAIFDVDDRWRDAVGGMIGGVAVGAVVLTVSCFINIATYDLQL